MSNLSPEPNAQDVNPFDYDYTEGAGEHDLAEAIEIRGRSSDRRDSMSGWNGEEEGTCSRFSSSFYTTRMNVPCLFLLSVQQTNRRLFFQAQEASLSLPRSPPCITI